jgi:hypothetical protein
MRYGGGGGGAESCASGGGDGGECGDEGERGGEGECGGGGGISQDTLGRECMMTTYRGGDAEGIRADAT